MEIYFALILEAVINKLISGLTFSSSSRPFDETTILLSWYELVNPMLNMLEIFEMACCYRVKNILIAFHPLLRLCIESRDHQAISVG